MKSPILPATTALALLLVSTVASADHGRWHDRDHGYYAWARVQTVSPIVVRDARPERECWREPAGRYYTSDHRNTAGTVLGAIVGGVLGNTIGKGDGRRAATVAGAVIGGAIGHHEAGPNDVVEHQAYQRRCQTRTAYGPRHVVGYDVTYRYRGQVYRTRMDHDPGRRMRVHVRDRVRPAE
jgi:uncharacterized protein YcfJ